ncbi:MAG: hypothetical protein ABH882_04420 [Candidatus Omnitrophota bacterium]|nr:PilZ domain-containing protein [Candidatus Omnitrophota bacterium]MBU1928293.1 PilZ domain-containing protein [Candidatus Omnitrophota bacterium]MBU2035551.1 PilZ domain-containing protein [Candidatus Omnitrophota bacterium]MBU2222006.1 PilZ domain-containing protein [Candidatus Omnitrophota bacterium]
MSIFKKLPPESERRKYMRLDTVFPVQFRLLSLQAETPLSEWLQGFTNDIGKGGLCLKVNNLPSNLIELIQNKQARLSLEIDIPLRATPINASAKISWIGEIDKASNKYLIGLNYEQINNDDNKGIINYGRVRRSVFPVMAALVIIFGLGLGANTYLNYKLVKGNQALVGELVGILQESTIAKDKIKQISKDKEDAQLKIQSLEVRIKSIDEERQGLAEKVKAEERKAVQKIGELNFMVDQLSKEKTQLQEGLIHSQQKENTVAEQLLRLDEKKIVLEKANLDKMYKWLLIHQNPRTGLVMSFEGDADVSNWAFIYDQSLVSQVYMIFSDFERARKVLDFFTRKIKKSGGLFFNAYYTNDGSPAEYTLHCGPNIWLGIAMAQYTKKTNDNKYLGLAEDIARSIMEIQKEDKDGGIRGGPNVTWYAAEHNLDAYSFFDMLHKLTGKEIYLTARDKVLSWLMLHTYDRPDVPIMRGKGDSTIATDTYAWSIAAIGPQKLEELGMNPDKIMEFAEEACGVEVSFVRPEGQTVKIKGFDFAPQKHLSRGGVVSSEWTAQMTLSFKIMAGYYNKKNMPAKSRVYETKANEYLEQLWNMIISSPSPSGQGEGCLPYATLDSADTGHGWFTPKGKYTGSVSGTSYTLFAYNNFNPLQLE